MPYYRYRRKDSQALSRPALARPKHGLNSDERIEPQVQVGSVSELYINAVPAYAAGRFYPMHGFAEHFGIVTHHDRIEQIINILPL
jgi:hypothetical protein